MLSGKFRTPLSLMMVALLLMGCGTKPASKTSSMFTSEKIDGSDVKRIIVEEEAVQRLDLQSAEVREDVVARKRTIGGVVESTDSSGATVRVRLIDAAEMEQIDRDKEATVKALTGQTDQPAINAKSVDAPSNPNPNSPPTLYYAVAAPENASLQQGQRVLVEITLKGSDKPRTIIPYSALLYDASGGTWVYTNPAPLTYVRNPITVDFIEADIVVITEGPAKGTKVVTVGVAELFGMEFGIGK